MPNNLQMEKKRILGEQTGLHLQPLTLRLKIVTLTATSYLEKLKHKKTDFDTTLFPCRS